MSKVLKKSVKLQGVGFKFRILKNRLFLVLGFSHVVKFDMYPNLKIMLWNNKHLELQSINKYSLNNFLYALSNVKKIDPYKLKGVFIEGLSVIKKSSKKSDF